MGRSSPNVSAVPQRQAANSGLSRNHHAGCRLAQSIVKSSATGWQGLVPRQADQALAHCKGVVAPRTVSVRHWRACAWGWERVTILARHGASQRIAGGAVPSP